MANNEQDLLWVYNPTKTEFEVKWGGFPYRLQSGEKHIFPRFIAEHFAKHLADAILLRREKVLQDKDPDHKHHPMLNHPVERPKIIAMINLGVYQYFQQGQTEDPAAAAARIIQETNSNVPSTSIPQAPEQTEEFFEDMGLVPDRAMGELAAPPAPVPSDISATMAPLPPEAPVNDGSLIDDTNVVPAQDAAPTTATKPKRTRAELVDEAEKLGLQFTSKTTVDELERMIKAF